VPASVTVPLNIVVCAKVNKLKDKKNVKKNNFFPKYLKSMYFMQLCKDKLFSEVRNSDAYRFI
jgi:hypothetical protein